MKTLFLSTLIIISTLSLNARENPFEMTDTFEEEIGKIVDMDEAGVKKAMEESSYIKEMQEKMSNIPTNENKNKVENLNIEPVRVANAKRTYTVYISCKYTSVHHTGETGGPIPLRKTITPVVTGTDDEKEGKAEAYAEGESTVIAMARLRLTEECGLQCGNCNEVGCTCVGCNDNINK